MCATRQDIDIYSFCPNVRRYTGDANIRKLLYKNKLDYKKSNQHPVRKDI